MTRHLHARKVIIFAFALLIALGMMLPQFVHAEEPPVTAHAFTSPVRAGNAAIYAIGTPTPPPTASAGTISGPRLSEAARDLLATPTPPPPPAPGYASIAPVGALSSYLEATRVTNVQVWTEYAPATRDLTGDCYSRTRGECVNALTVNINFETREESTPIITLGIGAPVNGAFPVAAPTVTLAATTQPTKYHQIVLFPANDAYRLFQPGPVTCTDNDPPRCAPAANPNHWDNAYMLVRGDLPAYPAAAPLSFKLF